jgi:hypothetical protein
MQYVTHSLRPDATLLPPLLLLLLVQAKSWM